MKKYILLFLLNLNIYGQSFVFVQEGIRSKNNTDNDYVVLQFKDIDCNSLYNRTVSFLLKKYNVLDYDENADYNKESVNFLIEDSLYVFVFDLSFKNNKIKFEPRNIFIENEYIYMHEIKDFNFLNYLNNFILSIKLANNDIKEYF